jgi:hypothetical protein
LYKHNQEDDAELGHKIKNMNKLNRDLRHVIVVDSNMRFSARNPDNALYGSLPSLAASPP